MNEVTSFEKDSDLFWLVKKFDLLKYQIGFVVCSKNGFLEIKNSDLCLLHKIKSFDLKNIISKKKSFLVCKRSDLFCDNKKKIGFFYDRKIRFIFFIYLKKIWKRLFKKRVSLIT